MQGEFYTSRPETKMFKEAKRKRIIDKLSDKHKDVKSTRNVKYVGKGK